MGWLRDLFWNWYWEDFWFSAGCGAIAEALSALYIWLVLRYTTWLGNFTFNPWWILLILAAVFLILSFISGFWEDVVFIPLGLAFILALPLLIVTA